MLTCFFYLQKQHFCLLSFGQLETNFCICKWNKIKSAHSLLVKVRGHDSTIRDWESMAPMGENQ